MHQGEKPEQSGGNHYSSSTYYFSLNMSLVNVVVCCLVGFMVTSDLSPGHADVVSFHKMLANFSSAKHLPSAADGERAGANLGKDTESRHFVTLN